MKKILLFIMSMALFVPYASAAPPINVYVNYQKQIYTQSPIIEDGTILVPIQTFETLGANVDWDPSTQTITVTKSVTRGTRTVVLKIGSSTAIVDGKTEEIAVPVQIKNGNTMVPLRFLSREIGATVDWNSTAREVSIALGDPFDLILVIPAGRYPETTAHINRAIEQGITPICTIDRAGAKENREKSLRGVPEKDGFDIDVYPMAICAEGGEGASVSYISPSDSQGAYSYISNLLEDDEDGTRVLIITEKMLNNSFKN
ncbi:copper amine oxidase N-terminal domain-containing protein [Bacillus solimangrovi]|uniref:Copper amine oxidase-like N-terminal domain-containing protein n=1 Tax=Bacillus solimangrovi TaxID=1305675 RepID=A0A1E5LJ17_9BACI|nr:copper amine oxidase N-terminal domain-containing protein [Bacillus solimangrovi]OEH94080.1 hypothetical protein BFG57_09545 [Bacillus solimangrovi]